MTHQKKPRNILSFKRFITESEIKESSRTWTKGWVNPKKNKVIRIDTPGYYHITVICENPRKFGVSDREIMKVLDAVAERTNKEYGDSLDGEDIYETILDRDLDTLADLEFVVMKKGWYRFYFGEDTQIGGVDLKDDDVRKAYSVLEREIKNVDRPIRLEIVEYTGRVLDISKKTKSYTGYSDISNFLKGKVVGDNRSQIGRMMAMFRGESVRKRRNKRSGMINSGFRTESFNRNEYYQSLYKPRLLDYKHNYPGVIK